MLRGILTIGGWTMVSRILGFLRDVQIASWLGTGPVADAFFIAFKVPNLFRRLFGEGAFNAALRAGVLGHPGDRGAGTRPGASHRRPSPCWRSGWRR